LLQLSAVVAVTAQGQWWG